MELVKTENNDVLAFATGLHKAFDNYHTREYSTCRFSNEELINTLNQKCYLIIFKHAHQRI